MNIIYFTSLPFESYLKLSTMLPYILSWNIRSFRDRYSFGTKEELSAERIIVRKTINLNILFSLGWGTNMIKFMNQQNTCNLVFCFEFASFLFILHVIGCVIQPLASYLASRMIGTLEPKTAPFFCNQMRKIFIRLSLFCLRKLLAGQNQLFQLIPANSRAIVVFAWVWPSLSLPVHRLRVRFAWQEATADQGSS